VPSEPLDGLFSFDAAALNGAFANTRVAPEDNPPPNNFPKRGHGDVGMMAGGDYNAAAGGSGLQQYFADMLLDSDRTVRYYEAITKAVAVFKVTEGRAPVVLDAGCGTGVLTACALVAGAKRVISVDVNKTHTDALLTRVGPEYAARVTPIYVGEDEYGVSQNIFVDPTPREEIKYDMLVSEILGTFANGESAFKYLRQYAQHMRAHASGIVYCVPYRVVQTFRLCNLPTHVRSELARNFKLEYMPTELVGWLFEDEPPQYKAAPVVVRSDVFGVYPFQCELPRIALQAGTYVAEWEAELWPNTKPLRNTWEWSYGHIIEGHSKHARARAWGLMAFRIRESATVNHLQDPDSTMPPMVSSGGANKVYRITADGRDDERFDAVRLANPDAASVDANDEAGQRLDEKLMTLEQNPNYQGADLMTVYLSARMAAYGLPDEFPLGLIYRCTLGAIVTSFRNERVCDQWLNTLDFAACFPLIHSLTSTSEYDVPIRFIPPEGVVQWPYRWLVNGAGFFHVC
jgi:hypothetical protein